jgi:hypothetical protein
MSAITKQITNMVDLLPEAEQNLAYEFVKRMVLAWDPDYTKVTPDERSRIDRSLEELKNGQGVSFMSAEEMAVHFGVSLEDD